MAEKALFDEWPERYDQWFMNPIGKLVKKVEGELIFHLLAPRQGEKILDAGCGTGVFTIDLLDAGTQVIGLDISKPMLYHACKKAIGRDFFPVRGDMRHLPFGENSFDKAVSITALEFIAQAKIAIDELFRVTKPGGYVVVATLNSLSPWAARRRTRMLRPQKNIFKNAVFRAPDELLSLSTFAGIVRTAVHFQKDDDPSEAIIIEQRGQSLGLTTGAFVAVRWEKPGQS